MFAASIAGVLSSLPFKVGLLGCALGLAGGYVFLSRKGPRWLLGSLHGLSAVLALAAVASFLAVGARPWHRTFLNEHDTYHYYFSAKYSAELGYDRLYHCTLIALDEQSEALHAKVKTLRSMGHYRHVDKRWYLQRPGLCKDRFTQERWREFQADVLQYHRSYRPNWKGYLHDKGYNATPAWTVVGRAVAERIPIAPWQTFNWVGLLDLLALLGAFGLAFASLGWRKAVIGLVFLCGCFSLTLTFIRGGFLRLDWLAALVAAVAMLAARRPGLAGALIGYATMVRVFPALFLFGPVVLGLGQWVRDRRVPRHTLALVLGFCLVCATMFLASAALTGPRDGWRAWSAKIALHNADISTMRLGLGPLLMYQGELQEADLHAADGTGGFRDYFVPYKQLVVAAQRPWHAAIALLGLALLGLGLLRRPRSDLEAFGLSLPVVFLLVSPTFYYYCLTVPAVLALAAAAHERRALLWPLAAVFAADVAFHALHRAVRLEYASFSLMSIGLAIAAIAALAAVWLDKDRTAETPPPP